MLRTTLRRHPGYDDGFSLSELLVVLVIVAILAALAFPQFQNALEGSRQARCIGNLRQNGAAYLEYAVDHNGEIAATWANGGPDPSGAKYLFQFLAPYLLRSSATGAMGRIPYMAAPTEWCPTFVARYKPCNAGYLPASSYSENTYCVIFSSTASPRRFNQLADPTKTPLLVDGGPILNAGTWIANYRLSDKSSYGGGGQIASFHRDGANFLYADGHVAWLPNGDTSVPNMTQQNAPY